MTQPVRPTLLLVDDEPDLLFSLQGLLRQRFDLFVAENGEQALKIVEEQPVHVVMSDQRMPGMTGSELLAEIRLRSPDTVPILLTGYADIQDVIAALNAGGLFRYLTKPWDIEELVTVLNEAAIEYNRRAAIIQRTEDVRKFLHDVLSHLEAQPPSDSVSALIDRAGLLLSPTEHAKP